MIWYILVATFLFSGFYSNKPKIHYYIALLVLFVFTAFRNLNLGDYFNAAYIDIFENISNIFEFEMGNGEYETGFLLLNAFVKVFSNDFRVFQIFYTFVAIVMLHFVIKKLEFSDPDKNLFLFIYFTMRFFINNFIILRQNIANMIIWYITLSGVGIIVCVAAVLISAQFHITSYANFVTVTLMGLLKKIDRKATFLITCGLSLYLVIAPNSIINKLVNNLILFAGEKYEKYFVVEGYEVGFNWIYYFLRIIFFIIFYIYYDNIQAANKIQLYYISAIAVILGSINIDIFSRFMEYYMIGIYGIMTLSYKIFNEYSRKMYLLVLYTAVMLIMIRQLRIYGGGYLLDYSFFF